jgi:hypothetical protein
MCTYTESVLGYKPGPGVKPRSRIIFSLAGEQEEHQSADFLKTNFALYKQTLCGHKLEPRNFCFFLGAALVK